MYFAACQIKPLKSVAFLLFFSSILLFSYCRGAIAAESGDSNSPYFIEGYDVVSYYRDSGPLPGTPQISIDYQDKTLLFSSTDNLNDFLADPEKYMPAYNGYCAYGMVYGMTSKIDPLQYDIVDGRLYLQLDKGTKRRWNRRISRYIKKSDRAWKKIKVSILNE